jgi:hypothetical protein
MQLMKERMKAIEQKNDGFGKFCEKILNTANGKDGMNKSKYSKLVVIDKNKTFME